MDSQRPKDEAYDEAVLRAPLLSPAATAAPVSPVMAAEPPCAAPPVAFETGPLSAPTWREPLCGALQLLV